MGHHYLVHPGKNTIELDVTNFAQARWSYPLSRGNPPSGLSAFWTWIDGKEYPFLIKGGTGSELLEKKIAKRE